MEVLIKLKLNLPVETHRLLAEMAAEANLSSSEMALVAIDNLIGGWVCSKQKELR